MKHWMSIHKLIAVSTMLGIIVAILLILFGLRPSSAAVEDLEYEISKLEKRLMSAKLPQEQSVLEDIRKKSEAHSKMLKQKGKSVMALYQSTYLPQIESHNWRLDSFIHQTPKPTRDLYMNEYDRIIRNSAYGDLEQSAGLLGLQRTSDSPDRYQLLLQLWCLEVLLNQAKEQNLVLIKQVHEDTMGQDRTGAGRRGPRQRGEGKEGIGAAVEQLCVMVLPPVVYVEDNGKDKKKSKNSTSAKPVYLRLGFRIGVSGTLRDCAGYLTKLEQSGSFFGLEALELQQLPPQAKAAERDDEAPVQLSLECVTYVPFE